jgi:hypothetical protein
MKCGEIEGILPGYLDGALTAEERKRVDEHLAQCPACRGCLADLKKAVALAGDMEKIEPPAGFTRDIMARVKEEAAGKRAPGFLRRLFFPLHVKIPLQAFATMCIVMLAFYLFRSVGPEVRSLEQLPAKAPDTQQVQENASPSTEETPGTVGRGEATGSPAGKAAGITEENQGKAVGAQKGSDAEARPGEMLKEKASKAEAPRTGSLSAKAPNEAPAPASPPRTFDEAVSREREEKEGAAFFRNRAEEPPAAQMPAQVLKKTEARGAGVSAESRDAALPAAEDKADKVRAASPGTKSLAAPVRSAAPAAPQVTVTLTVRDLDEGVKAVERILADLHARVVSREMLPGQVVLVSEMPADQVGAYVKKVGETGRLEGKPDAGALSGGVARIKTVVKSHTE